MRIPLHVSLVSFAFVLALGCARTLPERAAVNASPIQMRTGEWRVVDQVFVVTDASGTMYMEKTFPEAKSLSRGFIRAMPEASEPAANPDRYQASVIGFGGNDRVVAPLGRFDRSRLDGKAQEIHIMGDPNGLGGTTPLDQVLGEIQTALRGTSGRAAVVIFSDGLPDRPDDALVAARRLAMSHPDGVCFHGVQTGDDPEGTAFLTALKGVTGCGSVARAATVDNPTGLDTLARTVFTGEAHTPPVGAGSPCAGRVRLHGIEFGFDRSDISGSSAAVLDAAAAELRRCPNVRVTIDGYTDSIGTEAYNEGLSARRANAVRDYFVGEGLDRGRFEARGLGESDPVASNATDEGRAQNRRVELMPQ